MMMMNADGTAAATQTSQPHHHNPRPPPTAARLVLQLAHGDKLVALPPTQPQDEMMMAWMVLRPPHPPTPRLGLQLAHGDELQVALLGPSSVLLGEADLEAPAEVLGPLAQTLERRGVALPHL